MIHHLTMGIGTVGRSIKCYAPHISSVTYGDSGDVYLAPSDGITFSDVESKDDSHHSAELNSRADIKILLCEDNVLILLANAQTLMNYLKLPEHCFLKALNIASALKVFDRFGHDIRAVMTDIDMPDPYAGLHLHDALRNNYQFHGPIAFVSGRSENDPRIAATLKDDPETKFFAKGSANIELIAAWLHRGWT